VQPDTTDGDLLHGLTPAQREAVTSEAAPLCILASAGAGKTRVLTRRIAYRARFGGADGRHSVAVTFTRKAAGELQHRLAALGMRERVAAGTFHSLASGQLHRWWADRHQHPPSLLERKGRLLAPLASSRPGMAQVPVPDLAAQIEWAKARLIAPDQFERMVRAEARVLPPNVSATAMAALYARYEDEKRRRGLIDFDDLLLRAAEAIEGDSEFAGAQRWRWRHIYVDEFQDLNPLQHRLLLAWLGRSTDLCVVGDPDQSIYGWNGADPDLLAQVPSRWPSTGVVRLTTNHRCSPPIVAAAAAVLGPRGSQLTSARPDGPAPEVRAFPSEAAEAAGIASGLRRAHAAGRRWSALAVLTRTNAQLIPIQRALAAAGVPFWAPSQGAILDDPFARRVLADLRRRPRLPIEAVVAELSELSNVPAGSEIPLESGRSAPNGRVDETTVELDDGARAVLTVLADLARSFAGQEPASSAAAWLAWLPAAVRDSSDEPHATDVVTLCSFHRAKGLEWEAVWVAGLEQGLVPIGRAGSRRADQEERRLLYVALTRAATELHCSWARQRTFGTRPVGRDSSPWLELIELGGGSRVAADISRAGESSGLWRRRLAEQADQLRKRSGGRRPLVSRLPESWPDPDPDLVHSLKTWRSETARSTGVPGYVILHDVTVEALAALRPSTTEELLAVPGLGPVKAGRYGPILLSIVGDRAASA
jgi:DNA helicase II / ATP-dependent DNA helicase PcrA